MKQHWPVAVIVLGVVVLALGLAGYNGNAMRGPWSSGERWQIAIGAGLLALGVMARKGRQVPPRKGDDSNV